MSLTKEQRLNSIHERALISFDKIQSAVRDERLQCLQDRRFCSISGAQWEGYLGQQFDNKPQIEVNKIQLSVIRIFNEYRNNRIDVDFISKDGADRDDLAETCKMLYRSDEQDSNADEAYDTAFEEAVTGGFGAWRLRTQYENEQDPEDERQRICFEPIPDADSCVFFDLDAKRQDKKDATECFVLSALTVDDYEDTYEDDPTSWPQSIQQRMFDWYVNNLVYVAEYYKVEIKTETIHIYQGLDGSKEYYADAELKEDEGKLIETLAATGMREIRQKKIKKRRVHKYILSGGKVLEDCGYIAGEYIPVVPVYGKRWFIDSIERCMGHVRLAKDAQRLKNMQLSKLAEIAALSSVQKPILTPEQIAGHAVMWSEDNIKNFPYLLVNPLTDVNGNPTAVGPAAYTQPPAIPPAMAALLQLTDQDIKEVLGNQQIGDQISANTSGKAVELVQQRLDMQTYIYVSNFAKAIKRSGEIWLSIAKEVMTEEGRNVKGVDDQNGSKQITLMMPYVGKDGGVAHENDLSSADFDIAVEVGPSSESRKQATVRALTQMMAITQDPETLQVLGGMAVLNMEGEGICDVRDYFRKRLVTMGVLKPTEEEAQQLQAQAAAKAQQTDPNALFLQSAAQEAQAKAAKARADTVLTIAKSKNTEADTLLKMSDIEINKNDQKLKALDLMSQASERETQTGM